MTCHFGDCRDVMRRLIAEGVKVQMCVTSPPYWGLRDYGHPGQLGPESTPQEYVANMVEVFRLVRDLLADDGTLWLNLGDSYANDGKWGGETGGKQHYLGKANRKRVGREKRTTGLKAKDLVGIPWRVAFALQADGWYLRSEIIWAKKSSMPEPTRDRPTKSHEHIFLLSKQARYFYDYEAAQEPVSDSMMDQIKAGYNGHAVKDYDGTGAQDPSATKSRILAKYHDSIESRKDRARPGAKSMPEDGRAGIRPSKKRGDFGGKTADQEGREASRAVRPTRNWRDVWHLSPEPYPDVHFATFPTEVPRRCIVAGSRPGDVVLDPFFGSGTTGQVAQELGRQWIGIELNEDYGPLQKRRTEQLGLTLA